MVDAAENRLQINVLKTKPDMLTVPVNGIERLDQPLRMRNIGQRVPARATRQRKTPGTRPGASGRRK
ncbi:MAG TPA: hypothetical protein PLD19_13240, partial [Luteimonas sp.]|nr:hypothetical protein [Luteimonas sp.]